jgi:TM2 domain-containing membrane protein YozV
MWYYAKNGQRMGPYEEAVILRMVKAGQISVDTPVWTQGMSAWVKLSQSTLGGKVTLPPPAPSGSPTIHHFNQVAMHQDRKDRTAYVLLAIFTGIGIHNFYAGNTTLGVIQLLLVLGTCGVLWIPVWIWCIIEAIVVKEDGKGVPFK